jgi:hypothetical protein
MEEVIESPSPMSSKQGMPYNFCGTLNPPVPVRDETRFDDVADL